MNGMHSLDRARRSQRLVSSGNAHSSFLGDMTYGEEECILDTSSGRWVVESDGTECIKTHSYYQWVAYVLLLKVTFRQFSSYPQYSYNAYQ